jgi:hypothetical protein
MPRFMYPGPPLELDRGGCPRGSISFASNRVSILSDAVRLLNRFFVGAAPPSPSTTCGLDPTQEALACDAAPPCGQEPVPVGAPSAAGAESLNQRFTAPDGPT